MARTKVQVQVHQLKLPQDERTVFLGGAVVKKYRIPTNQPLHLRFGSARAEVQVAAVSRSSSLRLAPSLAAKLGIHNGLQLCLVYRPGTRTLHIGPLIGVMVPRVYRKRPDRLFGSITAFSRELTDACATYGAHVFFMIPEDIHGNANSVAGWTWNGGWVRRTFPVPDVVYNRLTSRKYENMPNVQQFMKDVKSRHGATVFNEKYLNKTEVFDALGQEESLRGLLPESHLLKNYQMLKSMSSRHSVLFLKPITGSLGKGIILLRKDAGGGYSVHYAGVTATRKQSFRSLPDAFKVLSGKLKAQRYQIQQGLQLISVGGRPVDFRALVQRDETGAWSITSIVGRIAGESHFVSNLARGGTLSTVPAALAKSNLGAGMRASVLAKLRRSALAIAQGIESKIDAHFAELGIDLAVDTKGKVWLLEVNSKPSKDDNTPLAASEEERKESKIRPSVKRIVKYCRHAAHL
ncbi:YheC/YheD family protein [Paenibacillus chartarius]|uniref:YheC/YheD family protein n=1 Tax=Paenibacillus chartarius TaxID=747481 RepID=A0ABV6DN82_9BACL